MFFLYAIKKINKIKYMSNLLADFVVRFNTAIKRNTEFFCVPYSNMNIKIIRLLFAYQCIKTFSLDITASGKWQIKIVLLGLMNKPLIQRIKLISKPGLRIYWSSSELAQAYSKNTFQGFFILSTPQGICSSNELIAAHILKRPVAGEVLLKVEL